MPRATRRHDATSDADLVPTYDEEQTIAQRAQAGGALAVEKAESAAHTVESYARATWRRVKHYIPRTLLHRTKGEYYLMAYNVATLALWSYLTVIVTAHLRTSPPEPTLLDPNPAPDPLVDSSTHKATAQLGAYLGKLFKPFSSGAAVKSTLTGIHLTPAPPPTFFDKVALQLDALSLRASTTYASRNIGLSALLIQSIAALEPLHAYLGLTRSPVQIAAAQVASRLLVVWYFVETSVPAQNSPFYASMLLAWSVTEMLRSTYYLLSLLHLVPPRQNTHRALAIYVNVITTLRYTAFYLLYPIGAGSEYLVMLKGFPSFPTRQQALVKLGKWGAVVGVSGAPAWKVALERVKIWVGQWGFSAWSRVPAVFVWPASLAVLMLYMHQQRQKALGSGPGRSIPRWQAPRRQRKEGGISARVEKGEGCKGG